MVFDFAVPAADGASRAAPSLTPRWGRIADTQARLVARFGRAGVTAMITAVVCVTSLVLNAVIATTLWGPDELRKPPNIILPLVIPIFIVPLIILPLMSLLTHWGQLAASYRHLAEHDQLTGALNRHGLFNRAGEFPVGTLIVLADIDRFKAANDEYGHQLGDRLLLAAASKLRELMGEHAAIAAWAATSSSRSQLEESGRRPCPRSCTSRWTTSRCRSRSVSLCWPRISTRPSLTPMPPCTGTSTHAGACPTRRWASAQWSRTDHCER